MLKNYIEKDIFGISVLLNASEYNNIEIVKLLLKNNVDINCTNIYGNTSLIFATIKGHYIMVKLLLENNARKDITLDFQ